MARVSCVSCVSWSHWVNAAETHETIHWESGMRYHSRHDRPDPRSDRAFLCALGRGPDAVLQALPASHGADEEHGSHDAIVCRFALASASGLTHDPPVGHRARKLMEVSMSLSTFVAAATTCAIDPGTERVEGGLVRVSQRTFTDVVQSDERMIAGTNRPVLDLEVDPAAGTGVLSGSFLLQPTAFSGAWEGEIEGRIDQGLVRARGIARGRDGLDGMMLYVEFRQAPDSPNAVPPCQDPKAFFEMEGLIRRED